MKREKSSLKNESGELGAIYMARKKVREGGALGAHGKKEDEWSERYEIVEEGIIAAEKILRNNQCTETEIAKVVKAELALNDLSPSDTKKSVQRIFNKAKKECAENEACQVCQEL